MDPRAKNTPLPAHAHAHLPAKTLALYTLGAALGLALLVWLLSVLHPLPPRTVTLATGPEGSSYESFGKRYQKALEKQGIHLRLRSTAGPVEDLALLRDPKSGVDMGFVAAGTANDDDEPIMASLGTLCYEPLWIFSRRPAGDRGLYSLKGQRVSIGPEGSLSKQLVGEMMRRHGLTRTAFTQLTLTPEASAEALLAGRIDAVVLVNSYASSVVRQLVRAPGIHLASFKRADAYVALFPSLSRRTLPAGALNLEQDRPDHDIDLLATKTSLIVREDLHPAVQYLMMGVLAKTHARAGVFQKAAEFPAGEAQEIDLSKAAIHYYKSGEPFLQRYLPFWLAALVEQLVLLLIPIIGLTYPLIRGLMALYGWGMQRRIFSIYGELHWLELQLDQLGDGPLPPELAERMQRVEERTKRVKVAAKYMPLLYSLKESVKVVRARMNAWAH